MVSNKSTVLVIDGGGRGAVLVDKYLQSPKVYQVLAIPGNDLTGYNCQKLVKTFPKIKTTDVTKIIKICQRERINLIDVAQDDAVAVGVTDALASGGFRVFGPTKLAGQIEWDKAWARNFMRDCQIPIPDFMVCNSQKEGITFIKSQKKGEWFIKASGLAAGKGSLYAGNNQEAITRIGQMRNFGQAGEKFLIEKCLHGEEFSSFAILDGENFKVVGHAQDHKTVDDGDLGPNTGGMGCSSPPQVVTTKIEKQIRAIFKEVAKGLVTCGRSYRGILYLGGIIDPSGKVYVIEFNARWGDPEAQVILPAIKNDFYELANKVIDDKLSQIKIKKDNLYRVAVTAASRGYPTDYSAVAGKKIYGLAAILKMKNIKVFGAGVKKVNGQFVADGGRLFHVVGAGGNVVQARQKVYQALSQVFIEGNNLHYRTDIGFRDLERFYRKGAASVVPLLK